MKNSLWLIALIAAFAWVSLAGARAEVVQTLDIGASGDDALGTGANFIDASAWNAPTTEGERTLRTKKTSAIGPCDFSLTIPENGGTLWVTYFDSATVPTGGKNVQFMINDLDGDTWEDRWLGGIPFSASGEWKRVPVMLSKDIYDIYIANQAELNDPTDPWPADRSSAAGYQPYIMMSVLSGTPWAVWGAVPAEIGFDKFEIDTVKEWTLDLGDNLDANYADRIPMYLLDTGANWSAVQTVAGATCRATVADATPHLMVALDPDINNLSITYYDNDPSLAPGFSLWVNKADGDSWKDMFIGNVDLTGSGGWKTATLPLWTGPNGIYENTTDQRVGTAGGDIVPNWAMQGHQVRIGIWSYDSSGGAGDPPALAGALPIDKVTLDNKVKVPVELVGFALE